MSLSCARTSSLVLMLFLGAGTLAAQPYYKIDTLPNPRPSKGGFLADPDEILVPAERKRINERLIAFEKETGVEFAVVIVHRILHASPKTFSVDLFEHWGIGKAGVDNGLLLLVVVDARRWEFTTGYGLEGPLPDAFLKRTGDRLLVRPFRAKKYGAGLEAVLDPVFERIRREGVQEISEINRLHRNTRRDLGKETGLDETTIDALGVFSVVYPLLAFLFGFFWRRKAQSILNGPGSAYEKYLLLVPHARMTGRQVLFPLPFLKYGFWVANVLEELRDTPPVCPRDGAKMRRISEEKEDVFLSDVQTMEEYIDSVRYDVWICDNDRHLEIFAYDNRHSEYSKCPRCTRKTHRMILDETVDSPGCESSGSGARHYDCLHCDYELVERYTIPRLNCSDDADWNSGSSSNSSRGGRSSGSSSRGSSSSSSSSGRFGGGSTGGGGAGGSW